MPELRKDPVTGRWVIIAAKRGKRPGVITNTDIPMSDKKENCPFCTGREHITPPEVMAFRPDGSRNDEDGWWVRVVPNKYPAMEIEGQVNRAGRGMYDVMNGVGAHEVVIESPDHEIEMADMSLKQIEEIFWAYRERMIDLHRDLRFRYVMIFKNHGQRAGATLSHAHSQIIALPIVPKRVLEELGGAYDYYRYKERCVFCDIINQEDNDKVRIIDSNEMFIAFHPFASRFPHETWILPRQHESFFSDIQMSEVSELAIILKRTLQKFKKELGAPAYNFVIHTAPFTEEDVPHFHWHIELVPRLTMQAGFEWGTGFYINPTSPEDAAKRIRQVKLDDEEDTNSQAV